MDYSNLSLDQLRPNPSNPRVHSKKQTRQIADSIRETTYFSPIAVDEDNMILAGHGRFEAAKLLGLKEVPVIRIAGLSPARKRALILADNRIQESARWDRNLLAIEFPELTNLLVAEGLDIGITGFSPPEIDQIAIDFEIPRPNLQTISITFSMLPLLSASPTISGDWAIMQFCAATPPIMTMWLAS